MSSLRSLTAGQSVRESGGEDSGDPTGEGGQGIPGKADIAVHAQLARQKECMEFDLAVFTAFV